MRCQARHIGSRTGRGGFTIIELLVVVSLIVLLIAMLAPQLRKSRETARDMICRSQLRQIGLGFFTFAADHKGTLPGCYTSSWVGAEEWKGPWMGSEAWPWGTSRKGTLLPYLGGPQSALAIYRCPSLPTAPFASGKGSNGFFDYGSYLSFSGARRDSIPLDAEWRDPADSSQHKAATPLITEEDPAHYINLCCIEPGHSNIDAMGRWHDGRANYFAVGGNVDYIESLGPIGPSTWDWTARTPSGAVVPLTSHGSGFGGWQKR